MTVSLAADTASADLIFVPLVGGVVPEAWRSRVPQQAVADALETKSVVVVYGSEGERLALAAVADAADDDARRVAAAKGAQAALALRAETVALVVPEGEEAAPYVEGLLLGAYRYTRYKTTEDEAWAGPSAVYVLAADAQRAAIESARIRAEATTLARDLVNRSPDEKTATQLADLAREAAESVGLGVDVWDERQIKEEGLGGLLAVNRGSATPPAFIVLEHTSEGRADTAPVVLVGKAVTFDTGGLSLKPTKGSMDHMKADMAGGAVVIGAMVAIARLNLPLRVVALIPSTDNRPGEDAYVPGDVVRMHSGATVEVLNTDAEGRMLLADALSVARRYHPRLVVDVATLTGAQVVALGSRVGAVLTNEGEGADERLGRFLRAGHATGDRVAPLPMFDFYKKQLESDVADLKNVGGREAGTITAAKFLEHFTQDDEGEGYPWVHLDLAGPSFLEKAQGYRPAGGTGFGVRLLVAVLDELAHEPS
ncbi:MAG: leucyl aminopeptidase [Rhodothermaceae bacterium]|nr:leucyl aminopeptidase [Rhodothermaceae bacterium]